MENKNSNPHVVWHDPVITRKMREEQNGHKSILIWFTGLPSSGKSTTAHALEETLFNMGCHTYVFDGDNVRHGLCSDLGFSKEDRQENLRRIGEMSKLFIDAGIIAMAAFVSPLISHREMVKGIVGRENFIEVYCKCPPEVCEQRDPKGHYAKARRGEIKEFTGVSAPYEEPISPDIVLDTARYSVLENVERIIAILRERHILPESFK